MLHWMFLGKIPVKMPNSRSSWVRPFLSSLLNKIKRTVSSNFSIHLHTLSASWKKQLWLPFCLYLHGLDYTSGLHLPPCHCSRGVATGQGRKGAPARECSQSCQGSPLKTEMPTMKHSQWSNLKQNILTHKCPQVEIWISWRNLQELSNTSRSHDQQSEETEVLMFKVL